MWLCWMGLGVSGVWGRLCWAATTQQRGELWGREILLCSALLGTALSPGCAVTVLCL